MKGYVNIESRRDCSALNAIFEENGLEDTLKALETLLWRKSFVAGKNGFRKQAALLKSLSQGMERLALEAAGEEISNLPLTAKES